MAIDWDYIDRMREVLPKDLIKGMCVAMDHRDYVAKFEAKKKYLGTDMLETKLAEEFNSLSKEEKAARERSPGKYGIYSLADTAEVELSLQVIAREHFAEYRFSQHEILNLTDPDIVTKISERFPEITKERIANVLEPVMA